MATVRAQLQEARDNAQEIENELERANETVVVLSAQLEEVADYVETEIWRIIENLKAAGGDGIYYAEHIDDAIADLKRLVEEL